MSHFINTRTLCGNKAFQNSQKTAVQFASEPVSDPLKAFSALFSFLNVKGKTTTPNIQIVHILKTEWYKIHSPAEKRRPVEHSTLCKVLASSLNGKSYQ